MDKPKTHKLCKHAEGYLKAYQMLPESHMQMLPESHMQMLPESHILKAAVKTERMVNEEASFPFPSDKDLTQILVTRHVGL